MNREENFTYDDIKVCQESFDFWQKFLPIFHIMNERNNNKMKLYKLNEFAELVNITPRALRYLDQKGILIAGRTITNRRYYTDLDYLKYLRYISEKQ
jgi:hypothetical protein